MNDFGDIGGTGTGVGAAAAIWALVKVLKKDRVAEALEAVTKELYELRTQVAVLLDREDLREKRLADMEDRLRKLENGAAVEEARTLRRADPINLISEQPK